MPSNPYQALFEAVRTRLVDSSGPFKNANAIGMWADDAAEDLEPDERLISALCQATPQALLSYVAGSIGESPGGGEELTHRVRFAVRFGVRGPGDDYEKVHTASGGALGTGNDWGLFEALHWIIRRLSNHQLSGGTWDAVEYVEDLPIATGGKGKLAHRVVFSAQYVIVTGD